MIAVIALIALVAVLAVTGVFRRGLCALDPASCATSSMGGPAPTYFDTGALPAASDERAVAAGASLDAVAPGYHKTAAGKMPVISAGSVPALTELWGPSAGDEQAGLVDETVLLALDEPACGSPETGPCDTWEGLQSDSTAEHTQGGDRLSLLGLDPFVGIESETNTIDLTLTNSLSQPEDSERGTPVLFRHSRRLRDGATTASWTWQESAGTIASVRVERSRGGLLHSVTIIGVSTGNDNQVIWTTIGIPVTDSSRDALDRWSYAFTVNGPTLPEDLWESTAAVKTEHDVLLRLVHTTGQVTREMLAPGDGFSGITPQLLRDDPEHLSAELVVTGTEVLGDLDALGRRFFEPEGEQ
ncbi:hypothetical protein [Actinomyces qiguomingii]|uniref:hypothetical protein n=1 Tax=Actinomyces qiguomingii TaxID=2057800 RepID=UPI000CA009E0|nr:hypothetical protein [Actinomyces qiguomingii]